MDIDRNDPTLSDAMAQLAQMEANTSPAPEAIAEATPASGETPEQPASETVAQPGPSSAPDKSDTPAAPDPSAPAKPVEQAGSKFAKNQARLEGGWKQLNEAKATFAKEQESLKAAREEVARKEREFSEAQARASQPKYKPEDYETFAKQCEKQAEDLEAEGKFDEADEKRLDAKRANAYAKQLRENPPAAPKTDQQKLDAFKAQQKEWWGKAAIDFPKVADANSAEAQALKALIQAEPGVLQDPKGMYYAARLVTAETAAASVPTLTKERDELRAEVKRLNEKLAIPGDGAAPGQGGEVPWNQKNQNEQLADLEQQAAELDRRAGSFS